MSVTDTPESAAQHDSSSVFAPVPAPRSPTKVASFVERVLVELRHEAVAARYVTDLDQAGAKTIWCRVEHTPLDVDAEYVQIRDDPRLGVDVEPCSQVTVRERLCQCLDHDRTGHVDVRPLADVSMGDG
ncbi:hypothetical protein HISP_18130 (plasmid) [Haloarcula hispanica N601]|uniref:Uncharacterized protein n=2 Tax=Haloarcula hispanica TaxID=51589 RepID=V5TTH0_HALHI|nr:hypothetical protein [Haloarcula hispanica]AEM58808.1 hypothetical protein HAH_4133 [Haloarcula hispanica ATCC 33960]AHB68005.2 hypothetical protein HISP_18130 [Haloarcula hispanica N601]